MLEVIYGQGNSFRLAGRPHLRRAQRHDLCRGCPSRREISCFRLLHDASPSCFFDLKPLHINFGHCRTLSEAGAASPLSGRQAEALLAAVPLPRRFAASAELIIAESATDEDQRHQPDTHCERDDDPQSHRNPTGRTDVGITNAGPQGANHDTDHQNQRNGDDYRDGIVCGKEVLAVQKAG